MHAVDIATYSFYESQNVTHVCICEDLEILQFKVLATDQIGFE